MEEQREHGLNPDADQPIKIGKLKKEGGRGKNKRPLTKAEREVPWECYRRCIVNGKIENKNYIKSVMDMWNGKDIGIRTQASILSQIKCFIKGGLLSQFETRDIENKVEKDLNNKHGNEEIDFDIESDNGVLDRIVEMGEEVESPERIEIIKNIISLVNIERLDCIDDKRSIRLFNEKESKMMKRMRDIFYSDTVKEIPTLKSKVAKPWCNVV